MHRMCGFGMTAWLADWGPRITEGRVEKHVAERDVGLRQNQGSGTFDAGAAHYKFE